MGAGEIMGSLCNGGFGWFLQWWFWVVCAMVVLGSLCNGGFGQFVQWWFWVVCKMVMFRWFVGGWGLRI